MEKIQPRDESLIEKVSDICFVCVLYVLRLLEKVRRVLSTGSAHGAGPGSDLDLKLIIKLRHDPRDQFVRVFSLQKNTMLAVVEICC